VYALFFAALLPHCRREGQVAREQAEAVITLSTEHGFTHYLALGTVLRGWVLVEQGQGVEGIGQMHEGLTAWRPPGREEQGHHSWRTWARRMGKRDRSKRDSGW
jgi:hypothetical protein